MCIIHSFIPKSEDLKLAIQSEFKKDFDSMNVGQKIAYLGVLTGKCVVITGGGGVGKSFLIRNMKKYMKHLVLTASTGIAGVNIQGQTIDSFMGFNQTVKTMSDARRVQDKKVVERLQAVRSILIDEASMMRIDRFEHMDARLRQVRRNNQPFGGVQIILVGDFLQLAPVLKSDSPEGKAFTSIYGDRLFAFESDVYQKAGFVPYLLNEYVRNGNNEQRRILRNMRMGHKLPEVVAYINKHALGTTASDTSLRICKVNSKVDALNKEALAKLPGQERMFYAKIENDYPENIYPAATSLTLKKGCRVMLTINNPEQGYMNGDLGTVVGLYDKYLDVKLDRGPRVTVEPNTWENSESEVGASKELEQVVKGSFTQFPVRLGYAVTAHKSQGMTMDSAIADLSDRYNSFGLVYVVISRVTSFDGLRLMAPLKVSDIKVNTVAADYTKRVSLEALARREKDLSFLQGMYNSLAA